MSTSGDFPLRPLSLDPVLAWVRATRARSKLLAAEAAAIVSTSRALCRPAEAEAPPSPRKVSATEAD